MDDKLEIKEENLDDVSGGYGRRSVNKKMIRCPICNTEYEDNANGCPTCIKRKKNIRKISEFI